MSLLSKLFRPRDASETVAIVDIQSVSVGGAYVYLRENQIPSIVYAKRVPIETHEGEPFDVAALRALKAVCSGLIEEGAPVLARTSGRAHISRILVSLDAPWENSTVRKEVFEQDLPFIFSKNLVAETLEKARHVPEGAALINESIVGTILNGYKTNTPYGKEVHRAEVIVLASYAQESFVQNVMDIVKETYHTGSVSAIGGVSLRLQSILQMFPHEEEVLMIDAGVHSTSLALLRHGCFVALQNIQVSRDDALWIQKTTDSIADLAKQYPLPRIIFLLSEESAVLNLTKQLDSIPPGNIWLSETPPRVISLRATHFTKLITQLNDTPTDVSLLLMAFYESGQIADFS